MSKKIRSNAKSKQADMLSKSTTAKVVTNSTLANINAERIQKAKERQAKVEVIRAKVRNNRAENAQKLAEQKRKLKEKTNKLKEQKSQLKAQKDLLIQENRDKRKFQKANRAKARETQKSTRKQVRTDRLQTRETQKKTMFQQTYQAQEGFWWKVDGYAQKVTNKAKQAWQSKPMAPVRATTNVIKKGWNSKYAAPVRKPIGYALKAVNKVLDHPSVSLGYTGYVVATGAIGVVAAAATVGSAGIAPLVVASVGLAGAVGSKIVSTAVKAHQSNKMRSLEAQRNLLKKLKSERQSQKESLDNIQSKVKASHGTKASKKLRSEIEQKTRQKGAGTHKRTLTPTSKHIAKSLAGTALDLVSVGTDQYGFIKENLKKGAESAHKTVRATHRAVKGAHNTTKNVHSAVKTAQSSMIMTEDVKSVQESPEAFSSHGVQHENKLKEEINTLAHELGVPKMKNTAALAEYVRESVSNTKALQKVEQQADKQTTKTQINNFAKSLDQHKSIAEKDKSLDLPEQKRASFGKRIAIRSAEAFLGTKKEWLQPAHDVKKTAQSVAKKIEKTLLKNNNTQINHNISASNSPRSQKKNQGIQR